MTERKQNRNRLDIWQPVSYDPIADARDADGESFVPRTTYYTEEDTFTGLYDAEGKPINRPRKRVGFLA
jgi:hypothetical protein